MKVCITSTGRDISCQVDERFGRCQYFIIVDTDSGEEKILENRGAVSPGGAGIAAAQQVVDQGVEYLITGHVGPNAMEVLSAAGVKIYRGAGMKGADAVESLKAGQLKTIESAAPSHYGMRHRRGV